MRTLLAISLLAVLGAASLGATRIAEIKSSFFSADFATPLALSTKQGTTFPPESLPRRQMTREDYKREIAKVDSAVLSKDLNLLAAAGDEVEKTWALQGESSMGA